MLRAEIELVHEIAEKIAVEKVKPILAELAEIKAALAAIEKEPVDPNPEKGGNKK